MYKAEELTYKDLMGSFEDIFNSFFEPREKKWRGTEITSDDKNVYIAVEMPGRSKDDVKITYKSGSLHVHVAEEEYVWSLEPESLDMDGLDAVAKNGLLTIIIPKVTAHGMEFEVGE